MIKNDKNMIKKMIKKMIPEMIKKNEDDKINDKKMMNAMITKMIKWKTKSFKDFQCVAGSVLHNTMKHGYVPQRC